MTRKRNHGVVYAGLVKNAGRRPSPRKHMTRSTVRKQRVALEGGPLDRHALMMADSSCTLPIIVSGQTGRYVHGKWEAL